MTSRISASAVRATIVAVTAILTVGTAQANGDAARGAKKFYTCYGCHGIPEYKNAYPNYSVPKLRGQHAAYIVAAITAYKQSERPHATMHAQAASLSAEDIDDIAAYLQSPAPIKPSAAVAGTPPAQMATCAACHGQNGLGVDAPLEPRPPVLAGQHADYLQEALMAYRSGRRKNPIMVGMAQPLKDEDIKALAYYFEQQPSPLAAAVRQ
jgi:cytochrome c553